MLITSTNTSRELQTLPFVGLCQLRNRDDYSETKARNQQTRNMYPRDKGVFYRPDFQQISYSEESPIGSNGNFDQLSASSHSTSADGSPRTAARQASKHNYETTPGATALSLRDVWSL